MKYTQIRKDWLEFQIGTREAIHRLADSSDVQLFSDENNETIERIISDSIGAWRIERTRKEEKINAI